ncbi:MAG: response regulator [Candidatus Omnitrophica bacterium]|jgi:DNA-binding response OmpR family regulator|nr:response regulator [Candidatus Omnitrophota bacterium]
MDRRAGTQKVNLFIIGGQVRKMLVIDNEADICDFLERFFSERDFFVIAVRDEQEGLKIFQKEIFDVVVMNINSERLEGFETLKKMLEINDKVNMIVLSNEDSQEKVDKVYSLGASRYISKPLVLDELETAVMR